MTDKEIIQALRICATHIEKGCGLCPQMKYVRCTERLADEAITMIERLTAENAALREKWLWKPVLAGNPGRKGCYLVTVRHWLDVAPVSREAFWNGVDWLSCERRHEITPRVTHWMPLPDGAEVNDGKENS